MTTLIAVYKTFGCVGRCDSRCYEAKSDPKTCDCICGGKNHGAGATGAKANARILIGLNDDDLKRFAETHHYDPADLMVVDRLAVPNQRVALRYARRKLIEPELPLPKPGM
jgi:hypothetical protein